MVQGSSADLPSAQADQLVGALVPGLPHAESSRLSQRVSTRVRTDLGGPRKEWFDVRSSLTARIRAARILVEDDMGDAIAKALTELEEHKSRDRGGWDETLPIQLSNLSTHVQFLLNLAGAPNPTTHDFARSYLTRPPRRAKRAEQRLFREIMAEPFTGAHWGPSLEEEQPGWTDSEDDDEEEEISEEEEDILTPSSEKVVRSRRDIAREMEALRVAESETSLRKAKELLKEQAKRAYWKTGGRDVNRADGLHGWKQISTAPALSLESRVSEKALNASQLQRELIFALSGRSGVFFNFSSSGICSIISQHPNVISFSPRALQGLLETFGDTSTWAACLRAFVKDTFQPHSPTSTTLSSHRVDLSVSRTREAFAEACRTILEPFGGWLSDLEAAHIRGVPVGSLQETVSTPLALLVELERDHAPLLKCLQSFLPLATTPTALLDALFTSVEMMRLGPDHRLAAKLYRLFVCSAEPTWRFLGDWLRRGMPVPNAFLAGDAEITLAATTGQIAPDDERPLPPEFFISRDRDVSWADEDFWESGFVDGIGGWPLWLAGDDFRELIFEAGKARGLLRSLTAYTGDEDLPWLTLSTVLAEAEQPWGGDSLNDDVGIPKLGPIIASYLEPLCRLSQVHLRRVLDEVCGLDAHLDAIEGLTLMRGFTAIESWAEWLFAQIQTRKPWSDFQLLTSSLRDAIDTHGETWMNSPAIRARVTRKQGRDISISDLRVDYEVPFPLSQLFNSTSMDIRAEIFTFLLSILRARKQLAASRSFDGECASKQTKALVRELLRLRHRVLWIVDTIWVWICNRVITIETATYREKLSELTSLRDMISIELEHTRRLRDFCFLHARTQSLSEIITAILDTANSVFDIYLTQASDMVSADTNTRPGASATLPAAQLAAPDTPAKPFQGAGGSIGIGRPPRSANRPPPRPKRRRHARAHEASDSSSGDEAEHSRQDGYDARTGMNLSVIEPSFAMSSYVSTGAGEGGVDGQVKRMAADLKVYVRRLRRGVQALAGEADGPVASGAGGSVRSMWGMLAFALEDWKD